jgi:hypothetical protein
MMTGAGHCIAENSALPADALNMKNAILDKDRVMYLQNHHTQM